MDPTPSSMKKSTLWALMAVALVMGIAAGATQLDWDRGTTDERGLGEPTAAISSVDDPADEAGGPDAADAPGEDASSESWLFSYTARSGSMVEQPDGTYLLTLEHADENIVAFTDRPDRDTGIVPAAALVEEWPNLFADSAPNGVMVEHDPKGGTDSWVVELHDPAIDGSTVTFRVTVLDEEDHSASASRLTNEVYDTPPTQFRAVSLFIDDVDTGGAANKSTFHTTKAA